MCEAGDCPDCKRAADGQPVRVMDLEIDTCPIQILANAGDDPIFRSVFNAYSDRTAGVICGWPHRWNNAIVEGVRLVCSIKNTIEHESWERTERQRGDRARGPRR